MCKCQNSDLSLIDPVLEKYGNNSGNLITILQKAQEIYGYLPTDVIYKVAEQTGSTPPRSWVWQRFIPSSD